MACFFFKAISSKGIVLLAVDSEVLVPCGIEGLTRLFAQFLGMSFSIFCSCDLPVSEHSLPCQLSQGFGCFWVLQEKTCYSLYCQLLTTVMLSSLEGWGEKGERGKRRRNGERGKNRAEYHLMQRPVSLP